MSVLNKTLSVTLAASATFAATAAMAQEEVNVYSYRQPFLIEPFLDEFTDETGIDVNIIFGDQGLTERLKREGRNSPADVILTVDIGRLQELVDQGYTIDKFKVTDGNCYEIYGEDKGGVKVEIYFNPVDGEAVEEYRNE